MHLNICCRRNKQALFLDKSIGTIKANYLLQNIDTIIDGFMNKTLDISFSIVCEVAFKHWCKITWEKVQDYFPELLNFKSCR